ncbi:MAG: hypothetical protein IJC98_01520 [Clostridia bacterium]|nr:hypothetical protein [Clostridia bacterium]
MNVMNMLGIDTNMAAGIWLFLCSVFCFVFPYVYWKRNEAWKRDKGEKTGFFQIWRPLALMSSILFLLLGLLFFFLEDILDFLRPV